MTEDKYSLDSIGLFRDLSEDIVDSINQKCTWAEYAAGDIVVTAASNDQDGVFFVKSGKVRVAMPTAGDNKLSFMDIEDGGHFGEISAIDGEPRSATVTAKAVTSLAKISNNDFNDLMFQNPALAMSVMRNLTRLIRVNNVRLADLSNRTDTQRIFSEILRLATPDPRGEGNWLIERMPKHREIASWSGTGDDMVATALAQLIKLGLAKRKYPSLVIVDRKKIRELSEAV